MKLLNSQDGSKYSQHVFRDQIQIYFILMVLRPGSALSSARPQFAGPRRGLSAFSFRDPRIRGRQRACTLYINRQLRSEETSFSVIPYAGSDRQIFPSTEIRAYWAMNKNARFSITREDYTRFNERVIQWTWPKIIFNILYNRKIGSILNFLLHFRYRI